MFRRAVIKPDAESTAATADGKRSAARRCIGLALSEKSRPPST